MTETPEANIFVLLAFFIPFIFIFFGIIYFWICRRLRPRDMTTKTYITMKDKEKN